MNKNKIHTEIPKMLINNEIKELKFIVASIASDKDQLARTKLYAILHSIQNINEHFKIVK